MKRWIAVAVLVVALGAVLTGVVMAQGTTPPAVGDTCPCGAMPAQTGPRGGSMMRDGDVPMGRGMPEWAGMDEAVEKLLGMTHEQIEAERLAGKSLVQIAQAKGVSEQALIASIIDAKKAELAELVSAGKLTQAQADAMLVRMQEQVKLMVERTGTGPMWRNQPGQSQPQPRSQNDMPMMQGGSRGSAGGRGGMMGSRWNSDVR